MRTLTTFLCLLFVGVLAARPALAQDEKTLSFSEKLDGDGRLVIDTHKGSITVTTWDRDVVEATVRIEADEDEEMVEGTQVNVYRTGRTLHFETDYDEARRYGGGRKILGLIPTDGYSMPFVHYHIQMPRTAQLSIDDHKSEIRITGLDADLILDTYKGEAEIEDLNGALRLETYKGTVRVRFDRMDDDSRVETYKGDVTLVLPRNAGFDLDADLSRKGDLDSDFDLDRNRSRWDDDDDDDEFRAEVNGGGPRLQVETYKGHIELRRR